MVKKLVEETFTNRFAQETCMSDMPFLQVLHQIECTSLLCTFLQQLASKLNARSLGMFLEQVVIQVEHLSEYNLHR